MKASFDVQLQPVDLYRFNMRQNYTTVQGPLSIVMAVVMAVSSVMNFQKCEYGYGMVYLLAALLFLVYIPFSLWGRAKKTLRTNEVLAGKLHYEVTSAGIQVTSGEDKGLLEWKMVYKVISDRRYVYVYSNRINAYIIPREQMQDAYQQFKSIAQDNLEKYRIKLK